MPEKWKKSRGFFDVNDENIIQTCLLGTEKRRESKNFKTPHTIMNMIMTSKFKGRLQGQHFACIFHSDLNDSCT